MKTELELAYLFCFEIILYLVSVYSVFFPQFRWLMLALTW